MLNDRIVVQVLALLALFLLPPAARAGEISVTGQAEIKVTPNEVILTLGVESRDPDLAKAKADHDRRVKAVIALLKEQGIPDKDVATDYIHIEPSYLRPKNRPSLLTEYIVRRTVVVTLHEIDRFERLLAEALTAGANHVHNVQFRTTELRQHRDRARALAIKAAKEKAEALASELGQAVGGPTTITEEPEAWRGSYGRWWGHGYYSPSSSNVMLLADSGPGPLDASGFAPGQISITARVSVTFELRAVE